MGQICCTKYGEDGQSALILDKEKQTPQRRKGKKQKGLMNQTSEQQEIMFDEKSRNYDTDRDGDGVGVPQNTVMNWADNSSMAYSKANPDSASETGFSQMSSLQTLDGRKQKTQRDDKPDTSPHPYPEYRLQINKRLKAKLRSSGFVEQRGKQKQLITDAEFYREFSAKMKCLKEIQDEDEDNN